MLKLTEAESTIKRETAFVLHGRPVCIEIRTSGIKVWLKGKKESYTVPYDVLFTDGQRGSVKIPARVIADAKLAKIIAKREAALPIAERDLAELERAVAAGLKIGCVQHDCAVCQARAEADTGADL